MTTSEEIAGHLFPFSTNHEGSVNRKAYFQYKKANEEKQQFEAVLMGRAIKGQLVTTGPSTQGRVFEKYNVEELGEEDAQDIPWTATDHTIDQFVLWRKDFFPAENDPRILSLNSWIDLSQVIHEPIPVEKKT